MVLFLMSSRPQADAIAKYSSLFRRSEGLYLSYPYEGTMEEDFLDMIEGREIDLVVCSDAQAILGIGDQGVGVRNAPIVIHHPNIKLIGYWCTCRLNIAYNAVLRVPFRYPRRRQLSTGKVEIAHLSCEDSDNKCSLVGGIDPAKALAVTLDVGTDNQGLLKDELYVVRVINILTHCV